MFYGAHSAFKAPDNYSDSSNFALGSQEEISEVNHLKAVAVGELQIKRGMYVVKIASSLMSIRMSLIWVRWKEQIFLIFERI